MSTDSFITASINALAGHSILLDGAMLFLAKAVVFFLVLSIAVRWFWSSDRGRDRFTAIGCGLAVMLGLVLNQGILLFVDRVRPYDQGVTQLIVERSADPSFPSDHATVAFAIAFLLLLKRDRFAGLYLGLALLVGISRIYIGMHFATDIAGGAATALIAALTVHKAYRAESSLNRFLIRIL